MPLPTFEPWKTGASGSDRKRPRRPSSWGCSREISTDARFCNLAASYITGSPSISTSSIAVQTRSLLCHPFRWAVSNPRSFPGFKYPGSECWVKYPYGIERETWPPVTSDSFRVSSNELILKKREEGKQRLRGARRVIDGGLEQLFSLLAF
jgi:hypothetical protein